MKLIDADAEIEKSSKILAIYSKRIQEIKARKSKTNEEKERYERQLSIAKSEALQKIEVLKYLNECEPVDSKQKN